MIAQYHSTEMSIRVMTLSSKTSRASRKHESNVIELSVFLISLIAATICAFTMTFLYPSYDPSDWHALSCERIDAVCSFQ